MAKCAIYEEGRIAWRAAHYKFYNNNKSKNDTPTTYYYPAPVPLSQSTQTHLV